MENFVENKEQLVRTQMPSVLNTEDGKEITEVSGSAIGSANQAAINMAGSKITAGVGKLNNSKGTGAQVSNVQGSVNFGNVTTKNVPPEKTTTAKPSRFDNLKFGVEIKRRDNEQELSR